MDPNARTPTDLPNNAQVGKETVETAKGLAQGSAQSVKDAVDSIRPAVDDAKAAAYSAIDTGKAYARDAVDAAGQKLDEFKIQAGQLKEKGVQFVADDPMKAVAYAAAGSAVLTAVLLSLIRGRR